MNKEFGGPSEEESNWQEQTDKVLEEENKLGIMGRLAEYLQKMPGGKFLLPSAIMLSMLGGSVQEAEAGAREYLSYENGVKMTSPLVLASEFQAGVIRKSEGSYIIEDKERLPEADTLVGDLIYRSGQELNLPQDTEKFIKDDLSNYKKELSGACGDQKLITALEAEMGDFAQETFPSGYNKEGYVTVERLNSLGEVEKKPINAQWAKFREVELEVSEHFKKIQGKIYSSLKGESRAKVTDIVLRQHGDLVEKAALCNMARSQNSEQIGQN
ncbi:MAG: hypothetical protein WCV58_00030 [Patescibacteria group bacterium]